MHGPAATGGVFQVLVVPASEEARRAASPTLVRLAPVTANTCSAALLRAGRPSLPLSGAKLYALRAAVPDLAPPVLALPIAVRALPTARRRSARAVESATL